MQKTRKILKLISILLGVVIVLLLCWRVLALRHKAHQASHPALNPAEGFGRVPDFSFTNQEGESFGSMNLKGKNWLANFMFTRCAGPCPIMTAKMVKLQKEFSSSNLNFLSFSVDPNHDKPAILKDYGRKYKADLTRWNFLTGDKKELYQLIRGHFHLAVEHDPHFEHTGTEDDILHSLHFVLVDKKGVIQGYYNSNDIEAMDDLKVKLHHLLNEESSS